MQWEKIEEPKDLAAVLADRPDVARLAKDLVAAPLAWWQVSDLNETMDGIGIAPLATWGVLKKALALAAAGVNVRGRFEVEPRNREGARNPDRNYARARFVPS